MSVRNHLNVTDEMTCLDLIQSLFFNGSFPQISVVGAHDKTCQPVKVCQRQTTVSPLRLPEFFLIHRDFGQVPSVPQCHQCGQACGAGRLLVAAESLLSPIPCPDLAARLLQAKLCCPAGYS